jgi:hypothetical protein
MNRNNRLRGVTIVSAIGLAAFAGCFSLDDSGPTERSDGGSTAGASGSPGAAGQGGAAGRGGGGGGQGGSSGGTGGNAGTNGTSGSGSGGTTAGAGGSAGASGGGTGTGGASGAGGAGATGGAGGAGRGGTGGTGAGSSGAAGKSGASGAAGGAGAGGTAGGAGAGGAADGGGAGGAPTASQLLALVQNCSSVVSTHKYATDEGGNANIDICSLNGALFWKGDMDIDCDGRDVGDMKCPGNDCCYQPQTAYTNKSGMPLAASLTPYVVIPNDFKYTGLKGGTVVAVIYNGKIQYAVFGDTGPDTIIGEASYACADKLGINPDPGNGGTGSGVTYIAFVGTGTVPADIENLSETQTLGEKLAAQLILNNKPD